MPPDGAAANVRRVISGLPQGAVDVPAAVSAVAAGRPLRPVWRNELGGLTFEIGAGAGRSFVKFAPAGSGLPLHREAERLRWAGRYTPVPEVLAEGADETGFWLHTAGVPGRSAVDGRWLADPGPAVAAIGHGLRELHARLPVDQCPFTWSVTDRVAGRPVDEEAPPIDRLVVCHGDACAPNTLIADDGRWSGHVDLATLGVADRWADLAVASYSLGWNYGPQWEPVLFAAYGVEPDRDRIAFYRWLWDLGSA